MFEGRGYNFNTPTFLVVVHLNFQKVHFQKIVTFSVLKAITLPQKLTGGDQQYDYLTTVTNIAYYNQPMSRA